jgi:acetolactate synthase-1/2/3 large subunit
MTGLYEAQVASSRVLLITGQIESLFYGKGKGFLHEAEAQLPMLRTVTRRAESVRRTEDIARSIVDVARDISTGRPAPGAVEIPIDLQYARAEVDVPHVEAWPRVRPDRAALARAAEVLRSARRVLIWAGGGVLSAGAESELVQLAEAIGAPVVTSPNGRGAIPEDHPLALGPLSAHPGLSEVFDTAEAVLAVGTRFQAGATRNWSLRFGAKLVHVDADPAVIGRNYAPEVAVVGDARLALSQLLRDLAGHRADPGFAGRAAALRDAAREQIRREIGPDYAAIMDAIRELAPRDALIVRDATVPAYLWGNRLLPIVAPRTSIYPTSAAIGPALPLAIGGAIGTGRPAVVIQGDGGFMLNLGELATAAQYSVPVVVCVFNDRGYGVLRTIEGRTFEGRQFGVDLATPDFVRLAEAMQIRAEAVDSALGFREALTRALKHGGPYLLDIDMARLAPMGGLGSPPPRRTPDVAD